MTIGDDGECLYGVDRAEVEGERLVGNALLEAPDLVQRNLVPRVSPDSVDCVCRKDERESGLEGLQDEAGRARVVVREHRGDHAHTK